MTTDECVYMADSTVTLRLDSHIHGFGVLVKAQRRRLFNFCDYFPVEIGRDKNNVATEVSLFAEVDAETPKLIPEEQRSAR